MKKSDNSKGEAENARLQYRKTTVESACNALYQQTINYIEAAMERGVIVYLLIIQMHA